MFVSSGVLIVIPCLSRNVDQYDKKNMGLSATAARPHQRECGRRAECHDGIVQFIHRAWNQRVETPATIPPISDEPGLLEHPKVKGKPGLGRLEVAAQITDTALAMPQRGDDAQPRLIREGMGQGGGAAERNSPFGGHPGTLLNIF
jgi:hypothetical protein